MTYDGMPVASADETRRSFTIRIYGGLGNQMFQYASGLGLARRRGVPMTLDLSWFETRVADEIERPYLLHHWAIDTPVADVAVLASYGETAARWKQSLAKRLPGTLAASMRGPHFRESGHRFQSAALDQYPPALFDGYFQSERYFSAIAAEVRALFRPRNDLTAENQATAQAIERMPWPVSLHVRRGDYVTSASANQTLGLCSMEYYQNAIAAITRQRPGQRSGQRTGTPHFVLFSDDPDWVREAFAFLSDKSVVTGNADRPWEDMSLMALCHDNITANSSFSWWGAWLNPRADKTVIAPKRWFAGGDEAKLSDADLVPESWLRV